MAEEKYGNGKMRWVILKAGKFGFTLAEVLITLAVIGIVAALTIGIFLPKIHSTIRARQIATAEVKFTKAMEQMALNNAIGPYYENTQEFVDELQNYLKISKVCANDKLEECFGYDKLLLNNGEEFELAEIKSGANLGMDDNYGETVGLVTIDGTGIILSWNKNCPILEPKVYPWGDNTNETTSCIAAVMDINLDKSPNTENKDVALFRAESISKESCGIQFSYGGTDYCWGAPFPADNPVTYNDCINLTYIKNCRVAVNDYWVGTMKKCKDQGKRLPNATELAAFAKYIYNTNKINNYGDTSSASNNNLYMNTTILANVAPPLFTKYNSYHSFNLWSGIEYSKDNAWHRFYAGDVTRYSDNGPRTSDYLYGICINE